MAPGLLAPGAPGATAAATAVVEDADVRLGAEELARDPFGLRSVVPAGGVAALLTTRGVGVAAAVVALEGWAARVHLLGTAGVEPPARAVAVTDADLVLRPGPTAAPTPTGPAGTAWVLHTSGTTGAPTAVRHTLASLRRTVRPSGPAAATRWGLLYEPTRMAGLQVVLRALGSGAHLLDPRHLPRLADRLAWLAERGVDALSATPTLWRQVLQSPQSDRLRLRQVTLGGEIADQKVLDALRRAFPEARTTHVFASTETGAAFAVSDGRAGFPRTLLTDPPHGVRLDVRDGTLHVWNPGSSAAGPDGFAPTGDAVELTADRVLFLGRRSGAVNVGGTVVWPERVEQALREHPGVADAVVRARANPFSGHVLTATVVPTDPTRDPGALGRELRAWCAERRAPAEVPATVRVVAALATGGTGKASRR